jgi:hypothetical protein
MTISWVLLGFGMTGTSGHSLAISCWITAMNDKWHAKLAQSPAYRCSVLSTEMQIDHRS